MGIKPTVIKLFTPKHNGNIKRSHIKDHKEFYTSHTFYSFQDFKNQLTLSQQQYHNSSMGSLN